MSYLGKTSGKTIQFMYRTMRKKKLLLFDPLSFKDCLLCRPQFIFILPCHTEEYMENPLPPPPTIGEARRE
jgi:hypothetical protein